MDDVYNKYNNHEQGIILGNIFLPTESMTLFPSLQYCTVANFLISLLCCFIVLLFFVK